jgi:4-amino-4-deoxy-L-arabinose transferase-like glycosyltransferase
MGVAVSGRSLSQWLCPEAVGILVILLTIVRLFIGGQVGLSHDEAYYAFWSTGLSTGYLDHPPMVALLIAGGRAILGNSELGVRFLACLCLALTSAALWRSAAILVGRPAAALAVLLYNLAPAQIGFIVTPDAPSVLFWAGALWAVAEFIGSRRPSWGLVVGLMTGLGLWSKYTDAFLPLGLLLFVLTGRERRSWLRLWQVWAGGVLAGLVFLPVVLWNWQHDWASFRFQGARTVAEGIDPAFLTHLVELFGGFVVTLGPVVAPSAFFGLVATLVLPRNAFWQRLALPVWTSVPALAYFAVHSLHGGVQPNWPLPLSTALVLIGAAVLAGLWKHVRWLAGLLIGLQLIVGTAAIVIVSAQVLWQPLDLGSNDRSNEMRDWRTLTSEILTAAKESGAGWIATSGDYVLTGELGIYALFLGNPVPVRQINEPMRWLFLSPLPTAIASGPAIFVAKTNEPPREFASARLLKMVERRDSRRVFAQYWLYLVSGPQDGVPAN